MFRRETALNYVMRVLTCLLVSSAFLLQAQADDGEKPSELSKQEVTKRKAALRRRVSEWYRDRRHLAGLCRHCKGSGRVTSVSVGRGGGRQTHTCPTCDGRRRSVSAKIYKSLFYDMRTPAFREQPKIEDELNRAYLSANRGNPWPRTLKSYRIADVELVEDRFGVSTVHENGSKKATQMRWILTEASDGDHEWFVWTDKVDPPWPATREAQPETPEGEPSLLPDSEPLEEQEKGSVSTAAAEATAAFRLREAGKRGKTLVLHLSPRSVGFEGDADKLAGTAAVRLAHKFLPEKAGWEGLECAWYRQMRNKYGEVQTRLFATSFLASNEYAKVIWENLSAHEQANLFTWQWVRDEGWIPWEK